jgi:hypothetical protein
MGINKNNADNTTPANSILEGVRSLPLLYGTFKSINANKNEPARQLVEIIKHSVQESIINLLFRLYPYTPVPDNELVIVGDTVWDKIL